MQDATNRRSARWLRSGLLLGLLVFAPLLRAGSLATVLLVDGADNTIHSRFVDGLRKGLARLAADVRLQRGAGTRSEIRAAHPALIVTVGTGAAARIARLAPQVPVLNALVPQASYAALAAGGRAPPAHSAVYIDQPIGRTLDLIATALPQVHEVAALLGPVSHRRLAVLRSAADARRLRLVIATLHDAKGIDTALARLLRGDDTALLALPDPEVVNGRTAKQLILGAYLRRTPLVGYSRAFVRAGALMAVYSTPEQVGATAARVVDVALRHRPVRLPAPVHPAAFSVSVNYELARALGIELPAEAIITARLKAREARR